MPFQTVMGYRCMERKLTLIKLLGHSRPNGSWKEQELVRYSKHLSSSLSESTAKEGQSYE